MIGSGTDDFRALDVVRSTTWNIVDVTVIIDEVIDQFIFILLFLLSSPIILLSSFGSFVISNS